MKIFFITISLFLLVAFLSCGNKKGYFGEMYDSYRVDSLESFKDLIGSLKTKPFKNSLRISCNDCNQIPFCGVLTYISDTIFFRTQESLKPFLILNSKRLSKTTIEYSKNRLDEVTNLGTIYDKENGDSLALFMLQPTLTNLPPDATYLKFITLKKGGIKHLTFANNAGNYTIKLSKYPSIIYKETLLTD